jgi:hypothetical protein
VAAAERRAALARNAVGRIAVVVDAAEEWLANAVMWKPSVLVWNALKAALAGKLGTH